MAIGKTRSSGASFFPKAALGASATTAARQTASTTAMERNPNRP